MCIMLETFWRARPIFPFDQSGAVWTKNFLTMHQDTWLEHADKPVSQTVLKECIYHISGRLPFWAFETIATVSKLCAPQWVQHRQVLWKHSMLPAEQNRALSNMQTTVQSRQACKGIVEVYGTGVKTQVILMQNTLKSIHQFSLEYAFP